MPNKYRDGTVHFTLRMQSALRKRLKEHADALGVSAQELVRDLIEREIGSDQEQSGGRERGKEGRRLLAAEKSAGES